MVATAPRNNKTYMSNDTKSRTRVIPIRDKDHWSYSTFREMVAAVESKVHGGRGHIQKELTPDQQATKLADLLGITIDAARAIMHSTLK